MRESRINTYAAILGRLCSINRKRAKHSQLLKNLKVLKKKSQNCKTKKSLQILICTYSVHSDQSKMFKQLKHLLRLNLLKSSILSVFNSQSDISFCISGWSSQRAKIKQLEVKYCEWLKMQFKNLNQEDLSTKSLKIAKFQHYSMCSIFQVFKVTLVLLSNYCNN